LLLPHSPLWGDPTAIEGFDQDQVLIADGLGEQPGGIFLVDYLLGITRPYITDTRIGTPMDILKRANDDLLLVDPEANPDLAGTTPVIWIMRAGDDGVSGAARPSRSLNRPQAIPDGSGWSTALPIRMERALGWARYSR
jgi:hypothetical protein